MAALPYVWIDAGLTTNFDPAIHSLETFAIPGTDGDGVFYIGHPTEDVKVRSDPGVDPITATLLDASPASGVEVAHMKLALTQSGLDTAIAGDPLSLGATVTRGVANAASVYFRWANSVGTSEYTEISLQLPDLIGHP